MTQLVIALTAAWIGRMAAIWGRKPLLLIGFGVLPVRGVPYTLTTSVPLLVGIQVLDGVANTIFSAVSILAIADLTRGSGRFNITKGSSYSFSFLGLAAIGLLAWILLWAAVPETLSGGSGIGSRSQSQTG